MAPHRAEAGDEVVITTAPRTQRPSGGMQPPTGSDPATASSSSNNNTASYRDETSDEVVLTTASRRQRPSNGKLPTANQRLTTTRRPLPIPSHLQHDTTSNVPDDEPVAVCTQEAQSRHHQPLTFQSAYGKRDNRTRIPPRPSHKYILSNPRSFTGPVNSLRGLQPQLARMALNIYSVPAYTDTAGPECMLRIFSQSDALSAPRRRQPPHVKRAHV
jgi:hypothetical protein